jgi:iron complex outermembrane receptor protein
MFCTDSAFAQAKESGLEEVVVTADRRPENQQNVAVSVGVLSGEQLTGFTAAGPEVRPTLARSIMS